MFYISYNCVFWEYFPAMFHVVPFPLNIYIITRLRLNSLTAGVTCFNRTILLEFCSQYMLFPLFPSLEMANGRHYVITVKNLSNVMNTECIPQYNTADNNLK